MANLKKFSKGYRHLWFEQYHRQIPQLSACTTLYG